MKQSTQAALLAVAYLLAAFWLESSLLSIGSSIWAAAAIILGQLERPKT